jgi:hypothetical protein
MFLVVEIFLIVALQGRNVADCTDLKQFLPTCRYVCEYSEMLAMLNDVLGKQPTNLERLVSRIDSSLSQFLVIGSPSNIAAALLFEHVVWAEAGENLIVFKRLRFKPALWLAVVVASLFTSIVENPLGAFMDFISQNVGNSAQHLVWMGFVLFRRMTPELRMIVVTEEFGRLPKALFYPMVTFEVTPEDIQLMERFDAKYGQVLQTLFRVMVPVKNGVEKS